MAVQALALDSVASRLDELAAKANPSDFERRLVLRSIEQFKGVNAAVYYMFMGVYYSILKDYAQSKEQHIKSLNLSGDPALRLNYSISMRRLGDYKEALRIVLEAPEHSFCVAEYVSEVFENMFVTGDLSRLDYVCDIFRRANPDSDLKDSIKAADKIFRVQRDIARINVSVEQYSKATALANQVLVDHGFTNRFSMITVESFDGVLHLNTRLAVPVKDAKFLSLLNDEIAEAIVSDDELVVWDRLIYTVLSSEQADPALEDIKTIQNVTA